MSQNRTTRTGNRLVVISTKYSDLPEKGEAIKIDNDGNVIAKFFNGMITYFTAPKNNSSEEPTLPPVA
jgi:hypothetical protein